MGEQRIADAPRAIDFSGAGLETGGGPGESYRFSEHPDYVDAFRAGLRKLAMLECDIPLAPHPSASKMRDRLSAAEGLVDREGCKAAQIE